MLTGVAADDHGRPVQGVPVTVVDEDSRRLALVRTDETGRYEAPLHRHARPGNSAHPAAAPATDSVTVPLSAQDRIPVVARLEPRPGETMRASS